MDDRLRLVGRRALNALGMAAVVTTLLLAWPGIRAARADDAAPAAGSAQPYDATPAAASAQPADATPTDASFDDFVTYVESQGRRVEATPESGPTCSQAANALAPEIEHRRAMAQLQAKLLADMRARGFDGGPSDVVVLNGSGYNYRPELPGVPAPSTPPAPQD